MAQKYTIQYDLHQSEEPGIGLPKMTMLYSKNPTFNFGGSVQSQVIYERVFGSPFSTTYYSFIVFELKMPETEDTIIEEITRLLLQFPGAGIAFEHEPLGSSAGWYVIIGLAEIDDEFDEGDKVGAPGYCNWVDRILAIPWTRGNGAVKSRPGSVNSEEGTIIDTVGFDPLNPITMLTLDLTNYVNIGDKKKLVIFIVESNIPNPTISGTNKFTLGLNRPSASPLLSPKIIIEGKVYPPEGFDSDDTKLKVIPNENDRTTAVFTWGEAKSKTLARYKIYQSVSPFLLPSEPGVSLFKEIIDTSQTEYKADVSPLELQTVYYRIVAEDAYNTGDQGLISNIVSMVRPDNLHLEATGPVIVGDLVTITLNTNVLSKRAYVEWGDAVDGYWVEVPVETGQFILTHRYSSTGAKVIKARIESSLGYWSDLDTICTKTGADLNPQAILIVRPLEVVDGESIRCVGAKSQPVASNALISQYDYYIDGGWHDNVGPVFEFIPLDGSQEVLLRITTTTGKTVTQTAGQGEFITVIDGQPTELIFSKDTTINSRDESRDSDAEVIGIMDGVGEVELPTNIKNRQYTINGMSGLDDFKSDIDKIRLRQETQEYTRINVYDEKEGVTVHLDGRITGYRITQTTRTYVTWSFGFRVFNRTQTPP